MSSDLSASDSSSPSGYDAIMALLGADEDGAALVPRQPDWIDVWLTEQLQDDPVDASADDEHSAAMAPTAVRFLDELEQPPLDLLQRLTGVKRVSLSPDDGSTDGHPRFRPWRLRHAMQGMYHGTLSLPWFLAARLVHAARMEGLRVEIMPIGVGSPDVPGVVGLSSLGLSESVVTELAELGVTTVDDVRAMTRTEVMALGFLSTALTAIHRLRGRTNMTRDPQREREARDFILDPFSLLAPATAESLHAAAEVELQRRVLARVNIADMNGGDESAWRLLESELAPLERRAICAELSTRTDEILELLHCL